MKKLNRLFSFLLALSMVLMLCACGAPAATPSPAPAAPADPAAPAAPASPAGPADITILVVGDNTPPDTNNVLKEIEKQTNTKLKVTYVSAKDAVAKLNTMIASQTLPDIFRISNLSDGEQLKVNGMVTDLTPYIANAPSLQSNIGDVLTSHPLNKDGVFALFDGELPYAQNLCVRTDWLKNVGMEMPTDIDSLFEVLKAFTFNDPDGNGQNDTLGLGASVVATWNNFTNIMGAFNVPMVNNGFRPYEMPDGTVTTGMKNPGFLEGVKYFNKLYQAGVMDPDFATIPQMDSFGKLWNGKVGVFDFQCPGPTNNWMPSRYTENPVPTLDFAAIKGPSGVAAQGKQYPVLTPAIMVSSTCKDPAAAIRVLDFIMSEDGGYLTYLGVEGTHYNWVDKAAGKFAMIPPYNDTTTNRNDGVFVYSDFLRPDMTAERMLLNEQTKQGVKMATDMCTIEWPQVYVTFEADTIYGSTLKEIEKEIFAQLISTKGDIDKEYADAISRWESEGGKDWEAGATEAYKSQK